LELAADKYVTKFELKVEVLFYPFNFQGKGRTIWEMINDSTDTC
jgi:hypothetical protein